MRHHLPLRQFIQVFFVLALSVFAIGCNMGLFNPSDDNQNQKPGTTTFLAAPVISPPAGDYIEGSKLISIGIADGSAEIYYTLDGSIPTVLSDRYTGPFTIIGSRTVRALAAKGSTLSSTTSATFTLNAGRTTSQMGVVRGSVVFGRNLPSSVLAEIEGSPIYVYSSQQPNVVKTVEPDGSFVFEGLDTTVAYTFYFSNKAPSTVVGTAARAVQRDEKGMPIVSAVATGVLPQPGAGIDLQQVELKETGTISGISRRFDVSGIEEGDHGGIMVFIPGTSYAAFTDATGNFSISRIPQGLHTIRASYAGYTFREVENVLLETDSTTEKTEAAISDTFELYFGKGILKGTAMLGDVSNATGHAGILVNLINVDNQNYSYTATTSNTGSFSVVDVYPGYYYLEYSKTGYELLAATDPVLIKGAAVTSLPKVSLRVLGGSISGSVTIPGKADLSGIAILAEQTTGGIPNGRQFFALTNSSGYFSIDPLTAGTYTISASYPGYKTSRFADIVVDIGANLSGIQLPSLQTATYSATGKVVLEGLATGFEGTSVQLKDSRTGISQYATTDLNGTYTFAGLEPGEYAMVVSRSGFLTDTGTVVAIGTRTIEAVPDIVLRSALGRVNGTVTLESAVDHAGTTILLLSETNPLTFTTTTDSAGRFGLAGIEPGTWRVQATKGGYTTGFSDPFMVSAGAATSANAIQLTVSLRSAFGKVLLDGRTDHSGIRVTATKLTSTTEIYSALSNRDGFYALSGMTPGEYILSFSFESYRSASSSSISLASNSSYNMPDTQLVKATGEIAGIANLQGRTSHAGIAVTIVGTSFATTTDAQGRYSFMVPSGNYPGGLRFEKEDFQLTAKAETIPVLTDSTYGVLTVTMNATHNSLSGSVDLLGSTDDSGIRVTIDGLGGFETITDASGNWRLDHVPLGWRTVRFTRLNTPDVTSQVQVAAADIIDLGRLDMIPDAATLRGHVYLTGWTDHSNILVTVTTDGKPDQTVRSVSSGSFEMTNILASGAHNVIFSKAGWDSRSIVISDLEPLEVRSIGQNREYSLVDTTNPTLNSVSLAGGANFTNSPAIEARLDALDTGSGLSRMAVQVNGYPSVLAWETYAPVFTKDLSLLPPQIYTGNGEYQFVVTVKDLAGNVSVSKTDSVTITSQESILKGVLAGESLILTKAKSPYRVATYILVPEGSKMTIEPGTEIRFAGDFYLKVDGEINAIGTEAEPIIFTKTDDAIGIASGAGHYDANWNWISDGSYYWSGVQISNASVPLNVSNRYTWNSGNIFRHCVFEFANTPLACTQDYSNPGTVYLDQVSFVSSNCSPVKISGNSILNNSLFAKGASFWFFNGSATNNIINKYIHDYN
jgi:hypothetical protein